MSISAQLAQGSKVYIEGSSGSAEPITAIALGYPTILTITGHAGIEAGDVVTMAAFTGSDAAAYINGKSFVASHYAVGATNDSFSIDLDSTDLTITLGAGTATPTDWTQIKEVVDIKPSGASASVIDVTDLDSVAKESLTGLIDNGSFTLDVNVLESDPGQTAVLASFEDSLKKSYKVVTTSKIRTFVASCTKFPTLPDAAVDKVQTGSIDFKISGAVTVTANV